MNRPPRVFISYSWTSEDYKAIVLHLAEDLRCDGVDVILDQWDLRSGHDKFAFMEQSIEKADKVLVLCDKEYAEKANSKEGGVGTETSIITPEVYGKSVQEKFIPVIMESFNTLPTYLKSRIGIDYRENRREKGYKEILRVIYNRPALIKPELGTPPKWLDASEKIDVAVSDEPVKENQIEIASGQCGSSITWTLEKSGKLHIKGVGAMWKTTAFENPTWYPYKEIITDVIIDNTVQELSDFAFAEYTNLSSIILGQIETIGQSALEGCISLKSISIPSSINNIKNYAFRDCKGLKSVYFEGAFPFENCIVLYPPGSFRYKVGQNEGYMPFEGVGTIDAFYDVNRGKTGKTYVLYGYDFHDSNDRWPNIIDYNWGAKKINWKPFKR